MARTCGTVAGLAGLESGFLRVDVASDLHVDFFPATPREYAKVVLPKDPSQVLVIAGDLGHSNEQAAQTVKAMQEIGGYGHVLVVFGNHDMYLMAESRQYEDSWERLTELRGLLESVPNTKVLDGDVIELDGLRFGGTGMWYDMSFGLERGCPREELISLWHGTNSDSQFIRWGEIDMDSYMSEQRQKLDAIVGDLDVVITHVGPDWRRASPAYQNELSTAFFYFDGQDELKRVRGTWLFGHTHERSDAVVGSCRLVNAALGYPWEMGDRRVMRIEIGKGP